MMQGMRRWQGASLRWRRGSSCWKALRSSQGGVQKQDLLKRYPKGMTKTDAANELGVTRATVYYMIADGRLKENGMGRVITQSVADLMYGNEIKHDKRRRGDRWPLRMGADNP